MTNQSSSPVPLDAAYGRFSKLHFKKYVFGLLKMNFLNGIFVLLLISVAPALSQSVDFRTTPANLVFEAGKFSCELTFDLSDFNGKSTAYANLMIPIEIAGEGYPSLNLWHVKYDGSRTLATTLTPGGHPAIHLGLTDFLNPRLPLGKITFSLEQVAGSGGIITIPTTRPIILRLSTDEQPRICLESMLAPIWKSKQVFDESILPVAVNGELPSSQLLFEPVGRVLVRNRALDTIYTEGVDYTVNGRILQLTPKTSIPTLSWDELYPVENAPGSLEGSTGNYVLSRGVIEHQLSVSYEKIDVWDGPIPPTAGDRLPLVREKLEQGEPLKIVLLGDSISFGASASRSSPPFVPGWGELFIRGLRHWFDSDITFVNRSRGGANSNWGRRVAPTFIVPEMADLCVLAFGMNDANGTPAESFRNNIGEIMQQVRSVNPAVEFILVAPMQRNEKWRSLQPMDTYLDALRSLESETVAVADVWSMSRYIARTKGPFETSDHINHPNDFIVRVYAQVALNLFDN
jgi:lysophospholipase L1-like esterase